MWCFVISLIGEIEYKRKRRNEIILSVHINQNNTAEMPTITYTRIHIEHLDNHLLQSFFDRLRVLMEYNLFVQEHVPHRAHCLIEWLRLQDVFFNDHSSQRVGQAGVV